MAYLPLYNVGMVLPDKDRQSASICMAPGTVPRRPFVSAKRTIEERQRQLRNGITGLIECKMAGIKNMQFCIR